MKKPWQIWTIFLLCLAGVVIAMSWLSVQTLRLDALREADRKETEVARQEAELQERISSALYRLDLKLLPLVSLEASRPHYLYESFYQTTTPLNPLDQIQQSKANTNSSLPSPLLFEPPEFVLLHFQVREDGKLTSPQVPDKKKAALAMKLFGLKPESLKHSKDRLARAKTFCNYRHLKTACISPELENTQIAQKGTGFPSSSNSYSNPTIDKILSNISDLSDQEETSKNKSASKSPDNGKGYGGKLAIQQSRGKSRFNNDFNRRRDSTQNFANQQAQVINSNQMGNGLNSFNLMKGNSGGTEPVFPKGTPFEDTVIRQGVMQPIWIDGNLVLARRIEGRGKPFFQCCWLDWEAIQQSLKQEVADILPKVDFEPIQIDSQLNLGTALTTIPVKLVVDSAPLLAALSLDSGPIDNQETSGLKLALMVAWGGLGFAALASALLFHGVMKLSERRAAFVSAVTHELRTPLTTFKMYAEMLAEKMVPPEKEQEYTNTLRTQADRLSHLVENVLQFARLERSSARITNETVTAKELLGRFESQLRQRVSECDLELKVEFDQSASELKFETQPSNVEQVLFNLVDNACKYGRPSSKNRVEVSCKRAGSVMQFRVRDFGPGIQAKTKRKMFQPFHKSDLDAANSAPGVGLGLALCKRMAKSLHGRLYHEACDPGAVFVLEIPV